MINNNLDRRPYLLLFSRYWRILLENSLFSPPYPCFMLSSGGTLCDINVIYIPLKRTFNGLFCCWQYGSIFIRLAVNLGVNRKRICDFLLVINSNFDHISYTVFEILTFKARKWLVLHTPPLFDAPARGNPLEFRDETYPALTKGMGLPYGESFIIHS